METLISICLLLRFQALCFDKRGRQHTETLTLICLLLKFLALCSKAWGGRM